MLQFSSVLKKLANRRAAGIVAALLVCVLGEILMHSSERIGKATRAFSYNLIFSTYGIIGNLTGKSPAAGSDEVVILYLDEESHREFNWPEAQPWNRATHAALVDRLTADGAKLVVFDIVFAGPGPSEEADAAFETAIRRNGRVVLAAEPPSQEYQVSQDTRVRLTSVQPPWERLRSVAAGWGIAALDRDEDWIVREHWHEAREHPHPSLAWAAATAMGLPVTTNGNSAQGEKWINYYDRPNAISGRSYKDALNPLLPSGYFSNKIVFVGARSMVLKFGERRDEYRTPYTTWFKQPVFYPAVDVHAHMLLNLMRGDWLRRPAPIYEWLIVVFAGGAFGFGLMQLRARHAFLLGALGGVILLAAVLALFVAGRVWFPWVAVLGQIVGALFCSFFYNSLEWWWEERRLNEQRRRDELRIREQAALLDKAQDAVFVYDLESRITYWNQSAERIYGWNSTEALNAEVEEILGNSEDARLGEVRNIVLEKGDWNGRLRQTTKAGREIIVESRCTRVCDDAGDPKAILVINSDVTERMNLEKQLLRSQRMESIGTLAGGIAHDLNNVLSPVLMATQLLQMKASDEKQKKFLSTIEVSAKRAADMVKQVLAFARGQEGDMVVLQIKHVIRDMEKIMRETFPRSIELEVHVATDLPTVKGDATQLHQVILNLCVNARDAMPEGGKLSIKAEPKTLNEEEAQQILNAKVGNYVRVTVTDTGTGMPPEVIERIYEPFFTTKEPGKGTGLGLSTVLSIIKSHRGLINVSSVVGSGTTFAILFPAAEDAAAQNAEAETPKIEPGNGTVLVIDDEPLIAAMAETVLSIHGYRVLLAENGAEGVRLFKEHGTKIVAVLCDMMMPVMSGAEALAEIQKVRSDVPVIVMSGLAQPALVPVNPGAAPAVFLTKPFTAARLLETLQQATAAPEGQKRAA